MAGIGNIQQMTFGAHDVAPATSISVLQPADKTHEKKQKPEKDILDINSIVNIDSKHEKEPESKYSLLKKIAIVGGVLVAGIALIENRKGIAKLFGGNKFDELTSSKFKQHLEDIKDLAKDNKLDDIKLQNVEVSVAGKKPEAKRKYLQYLQELAEMYNKKGSCAKITLVMSEGIRSKAKQVLELFEKGKIDEIKPEWLKRIKKIKIQEAGKEFSDRKTPVIEKEIIPEVKRSFLGKAYKKVVHGVKVFFGETPLKSN